MELSIVAKRDSSPSTLSQQLFSLYETLILFIRSDELIDST